MSETQSNENVSKHNKVICPKCGLPTNFDTTHEIDYTISKADNRVWCRNCKKPVKFSLK